MDSLAEDLRAEAVKAWPDVHWGAAVVKRGAFHDVLVGEEAVARISRSRLAASLMPARMSVLARLRGRVGRLAAPEVMSDTIFLSDTRAGCLLSVLPGVTRDAGESVSSPALPTVIDALAGLDPSIFADQTVRTFCGGEQFPELVRDVAGPELPGDLSAVANRLVEALLQREAGSRAVPIHGDLTPFNITWDGDTPIGLLDWDFCALGDEAIDIAGILTTLGRDIAEPLCDSETLERAALHRATFPLQIACAGYLHDDERLFRTGINNFVYRHGTGTLQWPHG